MKSWQMYGHEYPNHQGPGTWFTHITAWADNTALYSSTRNVVPLICTEDPDGDYYGWEYPDGSLSMVHSSYGLHDMCFPCGAAASEAAGRGRTVYLKITKGLLPAGGL